MSGGNEPLFQTASRSAVGFLATTSCSEAPADFSLATWSRTLGEHVAELLQLRLGSERTVAGNDLRISAASQGQPSVGGVDHAVMLPPLPSSMNG